MTTVQERLVNISHYPKIGESCHVTSIDDSYPLIDEDYILIKIIDKPVYWESMIDGDNKGQDMDEIDYMEWKTGLNIRDSGGVNPENWETCQPESSKREDLVYKQPDFEKMKTENPVLYSKYEAAKRSLECGTPNTQVTE